MTKAEREIPGDNMRELVTTTAEGIAAEPDRQARTALVAQQSGELAPVSLPDLAERLAGAVAGTDCDVIACDIMLTKNADATTAKFSFHAYRTKRS